MWKVFLFPLLALLLFVADVPAQQPTSTGQSESVSNDPATHGQIMEFMQVMDMRKTLDTMMPILQKQMKEQTAHMREQFPQMRPQDAASADAEEEQLMLGFFRRFPVEKIEEDLVPIYQKYYSRTEMDAILSFYESPVGRKMRITMPAMMAEVMQVTNARIQPILDEFMNEVKERIAQRMKKSDSTGSPK